jgi:hypothetical protein
LCNYADAFVMKFLTSVCYIEGHMLQLNMDSLQPAFNRYVYLLYGRDDMYNMFRYNATLTTDYLTSM